MSSRKRRNKGSQSPGDMAKMTAIYEKLVECQVNNSSHPFGALLKAQEKGKHPILPIVNTQTDVYKGNPQKKKKPIDLYLDTVSQIYKKKDLDILINPINYSSVFQSWAPREIAIFEAGILKFGKQFQFLSQLIETKTPKQVYEFYLEWRTSNHFKSFRTYSAGGNRNNLEELL